MKLENRLRERLNQLQDEYTKGKQSLNELEAQANNLHDTLLRISGAIQVIQEELEEVEKDAHTVKPPASIAELP